MISPTTRSVVRSGEMTFDPGGSMSGFLRSPNVATCWPLTVPLAVPSWLTIFATAAAYCGSSTVEERLETIRYRTEEGSLVPPALNTS